MQVIFNSSFPRAGSTLLQNVMAQNPSMYCSQTSGLIELLYAARQNFTSLDEFKLKEPHYFDKAWNGFCRSGMEGFYGGLTDRQVVVDKSRGWIYYYDWLKQFYPNPKVLVCVRDLRAVLSSMEKLHRRNAHLSDLNDNPAQMNFVTVDRRVARWMESPPVGLACERLKDAIQKGNHKKFFFVVYEKLMANPKAVMESVYNYLELPNYAHDFDNVQQVVTENDGVHGVYGDHNIRPKFEAVAPDWDVVLGPKLSSTIVERNGWFYDFVLNTV